MSVFPTTCCFFAGKYNDHRIQNKERINVLFVIIQLDMSEIRGKEYSVTVLDQYIVLSQ